MEGFDLIATGAWSILPPLLALAMALVTKEVYSSLTVGVFVGMVIYQFSLNGAGGTQLIDAVAMVPQMMVEQVSGNGALILFLGLLGALTVLVAIAGGSRAYAQWVSEHIKSPRVAQLLTAVLGIFIFVDDYFNCLTVGAVMRPITDRFHVSRERLAWIIDSMAAPICIIAPVSSWAVAVSGYLGEGGFDTFVASIPYNLYALLTVLFVFLMLATNWDFGSMAKAQEQALAGGDADDAARIPGAGSTLEMASTSLVKDVAALDQNPPKLKTIVTENSDVRGLTDEMLDDYKGLKISDRGRVCDLVIPIVALIVFSIIGMLYTGGFFDGVGFSEAIGENPVGGLCIGAFVAICIAAIMFLPRKLMSLNGFVEGMSEGVRSMIGAIMILVLAWSLGGTCRYLLGTGDFVAGFLNSLGVGLDLFPAALFLVTAFIGFAMGTSWGSIALVMPIVVGVFDASDPLFLVAVGATLAGSVYGDHISPISDTTILSSTGAKCNHLRHVATQIPYATLVMLCAFVGYIVSGFTANPWLALGVGAALVVLATFAAHRLYVRKAASAA